MQNTCQQFSEAKFEMHCVVPNGIGLAQFGINTQVSNMEGAIDFYRANAAFVFAAGALNAAMCNLLY